MSDLSQGPGWWLASDGKWYPPKESEEPPGPGWWLASDGKWYPPESKSTPSKADNIPSGGKATRSTTRTGTSQGPATPAEQPEARPTRTGTSPTGQTSTAKNAPIKAASAPKTATSEAPTQKAPERKPATKKVAPKKVSAATATRPGTGTGASSRSKPKPAPGQRTVETAGAPPTSRSAPVRPDAGLTPQEQIARRNQASQADARVLAARRSGAASRLLASLSSELDSERKKATESTDPLASLSKAAPVSTETAKTVPAPPSQTESPSASTPRPRSASTSQPSSAASTGGRTSQESTTTETPLLELRPSALSGDLSRAGERLAIYNDRVETIDRTGKIREVIKGPDIADIVIQKRITGLILSIEDVTGPVITVKGLTMPQAEQARTLIMRKTRPAESGQRSTATATAASSSTSRRPPPPAADRPSPGSTHDEVDPPVTTSRTWLIEVDEADLLRKLADLHRAGVLSDDEFRDKVQVIHRIVTGETVQVTNH